jgi:superfamily II DNA/RNA helicase
LPLQLIDTKHTNVQAVILVPTRERAPNFTNLEAFATCLKFLLQQLAEESIKPQIERLLQPTHIVVTGRLIDLIQQSNQFKRN